MQTSTRNKNSTQKGNTWEIYVDFWQTKHFQFAPYLILIVVFFFENINVFNVLMWYGKEFKV